MAGPWNRVCKALFGLGAAVHMNYSHLVDTVSCLDGLHQACDSSVPDTVRKYRKCFGLDGFSLCSPMKLY